MSDPDSIANQQALLATYRRTLNHLLKQAAEFGGEVFSPPYVANGLHIARQQISQIKAILRENGLIVEDNPDEETIQVTSPLSVPKKTSNATYHTVDITNLVATLTTFLIPFLPYLVKTGENVAEVASTKFGAAPSEGAKSLWDKVWPKIDTNPAARKAVEDVARDSDDEGAKVAFRTQLRKLLTQQPMLANELGGLLEEARGVGVTVTVSGDRSVGIGGSISGSTIITGDQNQTK